MRKAIKESWFYRCDICKTEYSKAAAARACEARILERRVFQIGDAVRNIEPRICGHHGPYHFEGAVIQIMGPVPSDYEYESKWLGGAPDRVDGHVFRYEVEYSRDCCVAEHPDRLCAQKKSTQLYYAPELELMERSIAPTMEWRLKGEEAYRVRQDVIRDMEALGCSRESAERSAEFWIRVVNQAAEEFGDL